MCSRGVAHGDATGEHARAPPLSHQAVQLLRRTAARYRLHEQVCERTTFHFGLRAEIVRGRRLQGLAVLLEEADGSYEPLVHRLHSAQL